MNDFHRDNEWQRKVRDAVLAPGFYHRFSTDGRYVFMDKGRFATILQKRFAVDTIVQRDDGRAVCIEEKIVRWPGRAYTAYSLETESCTVPGHESDGWMRYAEADWLLYAFMTPSRLNVHLIEFPKLKEWFWPREQDFAVFQNQTRNKSRGRVVPIRAVREGVGIWETSIRPDPADPATQELFEPEDA